MGSMGQSDLPDVMISCKDHSKLLAEGLKQLLKEDYLVDASVTFKGTCFKVHRLILAVFLPTLKAHMNNAHSSGIPVAAQELSMDYVANEADDVKVLLEFLYSGRVAVRRERMQPIGQLAKDLNVESLAKAIDEWERDMESSLATPESSLEQEENRDKPSINCNETNSAHLDNSLDGMTTQPLNVGESTTSAVKHLLTRSKSKTCMASTADLIEASSSKGLNKDLKNASANDIVVRTAEDDDDDHDDDDDDDDKEMNERELEDCSDDSDWSPGMSAKRKMTRKTAAEAFKTEVRHSKELSVLSKSPFDPKKRSAHQATRKAKDDKRRESSAKHRSQTRSQRSSDANAPTGELPTCETCKQRFLTRRSLNLHRRKDCSETADGYICSVCGRNLQSHRSLQRHIREVHEKKGCSEMLLQCPHCKFTCNMKYKLRGHVLRRHTAERAHKCPECQYSAMYKGEIERHVSRAHRKERKFMCELCGGCFMMRGSLNRHMMTKHLGLKPFKCEECGKAYGNKTSLMIHVQTKHTLDIQRHFCEICGKNYISRWGLHYHLRHVHGTSLEPLKKPYGPRNPDLHQQESHQSVMTETEMPNLETANIFEIDEQNLAAIEGVNVVLV